VVYQNYSQYVLTVGFEPTFATNYLSNAYQASWLCQNLFFQYVKVHKIKNPLMFLRGFQECIYNYPLTQYQSSRKVQALPSILLTVPMCLWVRNIS